MPSDRDSSSAARGSGRTNPNFTTTVITRNVGPSPSRELYPGSVATTKHEERTTCRRVVNHKTKQVETRVQRQLVYEDGKIIADSGPQITTKTTEDSRTEEYENTDNKNLGNDPVYKFTPGTSRVISEKTETRQVLKENKEESMQLRNETFHELTGPEFHQKALMSPDNALFIITDDIENNQSYPGKVVHYSCHSQKITDKEEVKEVSELKDGELKTETTRTHHHEEQEDDEVPEDEVDESALPEISKETIKNIEYYKDDGEFESLKEKLRRERDNNIIRENLKGRNKPITKKTPNFDEEEVIKNSETNRWLENHFGSDSGSDVAEPIRTKAGGNVINIQMTASPRSASREKLDPDHEVKYKEEYTFSNRQVQDHNVPSISKLFQDNRPLNKNLSRVKDWHTSLRRLPESHSSQSSVLPRSSSPLIVRESAESPTIPETFLKTATIHRQMLASSKIPAKKYFLGDNGTYEQHYTKYEPHILKKQSLGWKSTPSITDDYVHGLEDKVKHVVYKQKNVRYEQRSPERSVQRSHPPTEVPKTLKEYSSSTTSKNTCFHESNAPVSMTIPREAILIVNDKSDRKIYNTSEVKPQRKIQNKSDLCVQVDLSDEESRLSTLPNKPFMSSVRSNRRRSSPPLYTSYNQAAKYSSRFLVKKSPSNEEEPHARVFNVNISSFKPCRAFYFGDENDAGHHPVKKNQDDVNGGIRPCGTDHKYLNRSSSCSNDNSYVRDNSSSPSYLERLYTLVKDSDVTCRRSDIHSSMGDLRESSLDDYGHTTRQTFVNSGANGKSYYNGNVDISDRCSKIIHSSNDCSQTYDNNSYLNDKKYQYQNTNGSYINVSVTSKKNQTASEMKHHNIRRNRFDSSEIDLTSLSDDSSVYTNSSSNRRQRTVSDKPPSLPKKSSSLSSTSPSVSLPYLIKISQPRKYEISSTSSSPDSPSVSVSQSTPFSQSGGLFQNLSNTKTRSASKSSGYSSMVSNQTQLSRSMFPFFSPLTSPQEIKNLSSRERLDQSKWSREHEINSTRVVSIK